MALIFVQVFTYLFYHFKFRVSPIHSTVTSSPRMSGSQFTRSQATGLSCLGAMLEVLSQAAIEAENSS